MAYVSCQNVITLRLLIAFNHCNIFNNVLSLELVPLRDENKFQSQGHPHPQSRILLPVGGYFQNFQRTARPFYIGAPLPL